MARRTPTLEQKQAAEERRARMRELAGIVSKMTEAERAAIVDRAGGVVTVEGRRLSLFNSVAHHSNDHVVAILSGARPEDARLIAAAPLMLEALREIVIRFSDEVEPYQIAREAIRAATGEDA